MVCIREYNLHRSPTLLLAAGLIAIIAFLPPGVRAGVNQCPICAVEELVDRVDRAELEMLLRGLTGADKVYVNGDSVTLYTRYARSDVKFLAVQYICDMAASFGYEPVVHDFFMGEINVDQQALALSTGGDTVWVGGVEGKLYRAVAADGWSGFEYIGKMNHKIYGLTVDTEGKLWAACGLEGGGLGGLFASPDGGVTWELVSSGPSTNALKAVDFRDDQFGLACGDFGTVVTTGDWGMTWWTKNPSIFMYQNLSGCAMSDSMHFWVVSVLGYLFESANAGGTWTEHSFDYRQLFDIDFAGPRHGVIVGNGAAYHTSDGGTTWEETLIADDLRCVAMSDTNRVIAGGGAGAVWMSDDGGATWGKIDAGCLGSGDNLDAGFAGAGTVWLCGRNEAKRLELHIIPGPGCYFYSYADTVWGENISFVLEGADAPERTIMLCAHYDSRTTPLSGSYVCAPGADDNGTGVVGVLESARLLAGGTTGYSVEFVLFDGEEIGLLGSRNYAANLDPATEYEAVVNLDMLGYDWQDDMSLKIAGRDEQADSTLSAFIVHAIEQLALPLVPDYTTANLTSDHYSFYDLGIGSVLLIEGDRGELTPYYHSCGDVVGTINFPYFTECVRGALGAVALLAGYRGHEEPIPADRIVLEPNEPNPFFSNTRISFTLPHPLYMSLDVYDVAGRRVAALMRGRRGPERVEYVWDGRNGAGRKCASGIYFLRLSAGGDEAVRKIVLLR